MKNDFKNVEITFSLFQSSYMTKKYTNAVCTYLTKFYKLASTISWRYHQLSSKKSKLKAVNLRIFSNLKLAFPHDVLEHLIYVP